jgi:hypothetical protein
MRELLGGESGMDNQKLKEMLRDNPDKNAREAALKALKKIGGSKLENKELIGNMLGEGSKLTAEAFLRVANDLPKELI